MSVASKIKSAVKSSLPSSTVRSLRQMWLKSKIDKYKSMKNNEAIFDKVYTDRIWQQGTDSKSASGDGSDGLWLTESVKHIADNEYLTGKTVLEIGCGDFSFGSQIASLANHYTAGDVSGKIIAQNKERHGSHENVTFVQLDATSDPLPNVDVVIIRQVLQHLPNAMILSILNQVEAIGAQNVIVFEDVPSGEFKPNHDIETAGPYTRHIFGSGVDLTQAPFKRDFSKTAQWLHPRHPQVAARLVCYELN